MTIPAPTAQLPDRLAAEIRELEQNAPRLFAHWSPSAWRLCCEGPAVRLWDALARADDPGGALVDYLRLLREAVGLQYLSVTCPADLDPRSPGGVGSSFLAVALCEALPRLLPATPRRDRARALAQLWNAGEKLASRPAWLNRYLAARLLELESLAELEPFLVRALDEGFGEAPDAAWRFPVSWAFVDPSTFDGEFLPGELHLATPAIACVHDRRRPGRHIAVLLRRRERGGPLCLGATPCLGTESAPPVLALSRAVRKAIESCEVPDRMRELATSSGHLVITSPLSQRLWIGEVAA